MQDPLASWATIAGVTATLIIAMFGAMYPDEVQNMKLLIIE